MRVRVPQPVERTAEAADAGARLAACGLLALSGRPERPCLDGAAVLAAFDELAAQVATHSAFIGRRVVVREEILTERARLLGLSRRGRISVNGSCRLIRARDGWLAVNLPRADDVACVPAWLEMPTGEDVWQVIEQEARNRPCMALVERARLLGLAVSMLPSDMPAAQPRRVTAQERNSLPARSDAGRRRWRPLVVDLSALWAGPLAGQILHRAGATVIKVECVRRPDAVRHGAPEFFDRLNSGKAHLRLDFTCPKDLDRLRALIAKADVVISSARARALDALGLSPEQLVERHAGLIWIAITGHGLRGPDALKVGFGDDCAVGGGLVARDEHGEPVFLGDAIADPLTGLRAAALGLQALRCAEGVVLDVSLRETAALVAQADATRAPIMGRLVCIDGRWYYVGGSPGSRPMAVDHDGPVPSGFVDECVSQT